jgi:DNA gyrase/topoisomerase IV subunit A
MDLEEILESWSKDTILNQDALDSESIKIPSLHSKYLKLLSSNRTRLKAEKLKLTAQKHVLGQYYRGELNNPEDLKIIKREPWPKKIIRADVDEYVSTDQEMISAQQRIILLEEKVETLSAILDQLSKRAFVIKNAVDFLRLLNGG